MQNVKYKYRSKIQIQNTNTKYKYKQKIQYKYKYINTKWEIQMCDHQGKVSGLHDLHERGEPEMCNLLMTWFHLQNPPSSDFLHKIYTEHEIQIQHVKYTTHDLVRPQFSCSNISCTKSIDNWAQIQNR